MINAYDAKAQGRKPTHHRGVDLYTNGMGDTHFPHSSVTLSLSLSLSLSVKDMHASRISRGESVRLNGDREDGSER